MSDNSFTKTYADGGALTEAELDTALKSLQPDITQLAQATISSTSGHVLTSNGSNIAPSFQAIPDIVGPYSSRNYSLATSLSSGALTVALKTNDGGDATTTDVINLVFASYSSTTASYSAVEVESSLSITIPASATLGFTGTSTNIVYIYVGNDSGTAVLAVSNLSSYDTGEPVTTLTLGSSSDTTDSIYSTASATLVVRLLGHVEAALDSGLEWQTPSKIVVNPQVNVENVVANLSAGSANAVLAAVTSATSTVANLILTASTSTGANAVADDITWNASRSNAVAAAMNSSGAASIFSARLRSNGTDSGIGDVAISAGSGTFTGTSGSLDDVTSVNCALETSGKAVLVALTPSGTSDSNACSLSSATAYKLAIKRNSTVIANFDLPAGTSTPSSVFVVDLPAVAGEYTYGLQFAGTNVAVTRVALVAMEI